MSENMENNIEFETEATIEHKFCKDCGSPLGDEGNCPKCFAEVEETEPEIEVEVIYAEEPEIAAAASEPICNQQEYSPVAEGHRNANIIETITPKKRRGALAAMLVFTVILSAGLGFCGGYLALKFFPQENAAPAEKTVEKQIIKEPTITAEQLAAADSSAFNAAAVAAVGLDSVVEITTEATSYHPFLGNYATGGAGSGVIISEDGYIVTNHHVIEGVNKIKVRTRDGKEFDATIIGTDQKTDLAVIKVEGKGLKAVTYGSSKDLVVGQPVLAIGNPLGELGGTITQGIVSALDREIRVEDENMTLLQTDASISPGNSGGGLFDGKGTLIGIVNAKYTSDGAEGLGFAIPVDTAREVIDELIENGYVTGRAEMGVQVSYLDANTARLYNLGDEGVYIVAVTRGSAAEEAGLLSGDRILKIEDVEVTDTNQGVKLIQSHKAGETITIEIMRKEEKMTVEVTLDEQKPTLASILE